MNLDIVLAIALFAGLVVFYWLNEPKAKKQDPKLWQHTHKRGK